MYPAPLLALADQIFEKEGLGRISIFRGGCWERGDDFFPGGGGCSFYIKTKLKSEISNYKKFINKNVFLCHNQEFTVLGNFNKEYGIGLRVKNPFFWGGAHKKPI